LLRSLGIRAAAVGGRRLVRLPVPGTPA
jgi:hypothetical protein